MKHAYHYRRNGWLYPAFIEHDEEGEGVTLTGAEISGAEHYDTLEDALEEIRDIIG